MREELPLRFDLRGLVGRVRHELARRTDGATVTLSLPFVSFTAAPADLERRVAREVVVRISDRRVLSAEECCDTCINQALASIQSIRSILVDKQVELSHLVDGPLYVLLEAMLEGIRQFLTFEQRLASPVENWEWGLRRAAERREAYFDALEVLRGHLTRCIAQIAMIAEVELPRVGLIDSYGDAWPLEAYTDPDGKESGETV